MAFRKSRVLHGVRAMPTLVARLLWHNRVGFYLQSAKFSSHLRAVTGRLSLARFLGLNAHHGVEMLPKSLLCFDSDEWSSRLGPLCFPESAKSTVLLLAPIQS